MTSRIPLTRTFVKKSDWQKFKAGLIRTLDFHFWRAYDEDDILSCPVGEYIEVDIIEIETKSEKITIKICRDCSRDVYKYNKICHVCYKKIHKWVAKNKPKPLVCPECKINTKLQLANISDEYKKDINDYEYLCQKCHHKKYGHIWLAKLRYTAAKKRGATDEELRRIYPGNKDTRKDHTA